MANESDLEPVPVLDVHAAEAMSLADDLTLVDVREPDEFAAGHPAGARNVPLSRLREALAEVPGGPVAFTCRTGRRSEEATRMAIAAGRADVKNVSGGFEAWQAAHLPTNDTRQETA